MVFCHVMALYNCRGIIINSYLVAAIVKWGRVSISPMVVPSPIAIQRVNKLIISHRFYYVLIYQRHWIKMHSQNDRISFRQASPLLTTNPWLRLWITNWTVPIRRGMWRAEMQDCDAWCTMYIMYLSVRYWACITSAFFTTSVAFARAVLPPLRLFWQVRSHYELTSEGCEPYLWQAWWRHWSRSI